MPASIRRRQRATRNATTPQITVEQLRHLPVPITISLIKPKRRVLAPVKKTTVVNILKTVRLRSKNTFNAPTPKKKLGSPICRWYRRKRALNQLAKEHKLEQKNIERKKKEKYEQERLKDFILWESLKPQKLREPPVRTHRKNKPISIVEKLVKYKSSPIVEKEFKYKPSPVAKKQFKYNEPTIYEAQKYEPAPKIEKQPKYKAPIVVAKECKGLCINENPKKVQLRKKTKSVSVKKYNHHESITRKFVNCFYRVCCQFYCYLTCIIVIAFVVICLI